jgi:hypothetical protein
MERKWLLTIARIKDPPRIPVKLSTNKQRVTLRLAPVHRYVFRSGTLVPATNATKLTRSQQEPAGNSAACGMNNSKFGQQQQQPRKTVKGNANGGSKIKAKHRES